MTTFILRVNQNNLTSLNEIDSFMTRIQPTNNFFLFTKSVRHEHPGTHRVHISFFGYQIFGFKIKFCLDIFNFGRSLDSDLSGSE